MEIWLKTEDNSVNFRFPIVPVEYDFNESEIINSNNITKLGEIISSGGSNLGDIEISSFFPVREYSICQYKNFPAPYDCVDIIKRLKKYKTPPRLILTETNINIPIKIESFTYGKKDGAGNVAFTIRFKEFRKVEVPKLTKLTGTNQNTERPSTKNPTETQKTHTVVKGDNLWDIAQKYYGKGNLYPKIKDANSNTYTSLKRNNIIYSGWKLVIPKG